MPVRPGHTPAFASLRVVVSLWGWGLNRGWCVVSITANIFQEVTVMMRIGTRISPDWLDRPEDLRFLTQIGVDAVDITMDMVPGYLESGGAVTRDGMKMVVEKLGEAGQVIERANCLFGRPER